MKTKNIDEKKINQAAIQYVKDINNTKILCEANQITCLFIIQPHIFGSKIIQHTEIIKKANKTMPYYERIHEIISHILL